VNICGVGGPRYIRIARRVLTPQVAFDDLRWSYEIDYDAVPEEKFVLCDVVTNAVQLPSTAGDQVIGPGEMFMACRPEAPYAGNLRSAHVRNFAIHPRVLTRVATSEQGEAEPIRLLGDRPISLQAAAEMRSSIAYVREHVLSAQTPPSELVASAASQYLAARLLETFTSTALLTTGAIDRRDARPTTLRRAVAFIEANPDIDLSVTDIARAAHVTPRTLQLAFRHHLDTTPLAYLRRVRLEHAHHDLVTATDGDGETVTMIASRWGFTSSRFTRLYRAAYGRVPSQTLRE
jgi:AraC-like DNA-binding protein